MKLNKVLFKFIRIAFGILVLLLIVYAAGKLATTAYDFGYRVFTEKAVAEAPGTDKKVQIKDDMSGKEIGELLEEKGLVRDAKLFYLQYRLSAYWGEIEPGIYTLNTSMTTKEIIIEMCSSEEDTDESTEAVSSEDTQEQEEELEVEQAQE